MIGAIDLQVGVDAVSFGALFAVMALGLALLFGVMRLMNFAYGELIMVGGYTMYYTRDFGALPMILITIVVVVLVSVLMELIAFRPVRHAAPVTLLITSFAVSFGLQQVAFMTVARGRQKGVEPYPWLTDQHQIAGLRVSNLDVLTAARRRGSADRDDAAPQTDHASAYSCARRPRTTRWPGSWASGATA